LNIGDPAQFDFEPPTHLKKAFQNAIMEGYNHYSDSQGLPELRDAICHKELVGGVKISQDDIIVTNGISEGISLTLGSLCDPGTNVLIPGPVYPPYPVFIRYFGAEVNYYKCDEENGWQPDLEDIRSRVNDQTRAMLLINPNNPTGAVYDEKILRGIIDIAGEYSIPIISDEIYDHLIFDKTHVSTASLSGDVPIVGLNGFSGLEGSQEHIEQMMGKLRPRRDLAYKRLNEIEGLSCTKPEGAFYVFPKILDRKGAKDDRDFVIGILNSGVLVIHGSGFGEPGRDHFRLVYLAPEEQLNVALDRISAYMEK
jgi:aspartate/methionine/tyrosine aminotransferase